MRRWIALGALSLLCIALGAWILWRGREDDPRKVITESIQAAREGDVARYLACFRGDVADRLRQALEEQGEDAFARDIALRADQIVGVAMTPVEGSDGSPGQVTLEVEWVFRDRNERQQVRLQRTWRGWTIVEMAGGVTVKMPISYGTSIDGTSQ